MPAVLRILIQRSPLALLLLMGSCLSQEPRTPTASTAQSAPQSLTSPVATSSTGGSAEAALAQHLKQTGAKMYGTFWCPYCRRQEKLFGEAVSQLEIIECDPRGKNAQPERCDRAQVSGYPTWEINGQQYNGLLSLEDLANLSSYQGPRNFGL